MRFFMSILLIPVVFGTSVGTVAAESWPLWDGVETVAQYAQRVKLPATKTLDLGGGVKLELVLIPAGKFIMGTPKPEKPIETRTQISINEWPAHEVTLTKPFYLSKYPVTQAQYQQLIGTNPSHFKDKDNPVEQVLWDDAQVFCKKLSQADKLTVRLPTEAEWEYACRAGTRTQYYSGDTDKDLDRVGWYDGNSKRTSHPVGQKEPNRFGLYDMHGNVWQWCQDWFGAYSADAVADPQGPSQGARRVLRGGSWDYSPWDCRSANRAGYFHDFRHFIGFRVAAAVPRTP